MSEQMNGRKKRPNIVILNPDEMRWDALGHMGNRAAHTPALDRLAVHDAVSFDHAYCQNPVCVPSRCSFLTGLYPHVQGHRTMRYLMREGEPSLFSELKDAGYHVWMNGRNDFYAGQIQGLSACHADEIFEMSKNTAGERPVQKVPGPDSKAEAFRKKAAAGHAEEMKIRKDPSKWPPGTQINDDPDHVYSHFKGVIPDDRGDQDWLDTRAAVDRIHRIGELGDKPLCLFLGWINPHPPYEAAKCYYDQIKADRITPPIEPSACRGKSEMLAKLQEYSHLDQLTDQEWMEMRRVYLAQCAKVDHMVETVIDALKEEGIYDDTAIFIFSDHGDWCGDFHLAEKAQNCFEDVLTRVPFLIKPPKIEGEEVDAGLASGLVELVDFYATALDYAGVNSCHDHFGKSLRPVVTDRRKTVRSYAFCEGGRRPGECQSDEWHSDGINGGGNRGDYYAKKRAQLDDDAHEKGTMVTDGNYKYIYRSSGRCELYDLQADPRETRNLLAADAACGSAVSEKVSAFEKEILKWYQTTCDIVPRDYDRRMSEDKLWKIISAFVPAEYEEYCRTFIRESDPGIGGLITFARILTGEISK